MPIEKLRPTFSFNEDRLKELKNLVPEVFADGKVNWDILKESLNGFLEEDNGKLEHFGLFWPGKKEARRVASIPSEGTLVPLYGEGLKSDGTPDTDGKNDSHNIFIEGENLEVLKLLQKSYAGRIKMIYIDPPYNTGNDFVYDDNFTEPLQEYLRRTSQIDGEGKSLTTNKRADGRFHSKWLNMMYPRLRLARNLLRDDGVFFVSINDNEVHNLKAIMNEIFGEENFLAQLIWNSEGNTDNQLEIKIKHEYILLYLKNYLFKEKAIGRVVAPDTREDSNLWKGYADNNINKNNPENPPNLIELPVGFPSSEATLFYEKKALDNDFFKITSEEKYISDHVKRKYKIENQSGLPIKVDDLIVENYKLKEPCRIYGGFANTNKLKAFIENGMQPIKDDDGSPITFYINRNAAVRYRKEVEKPRNIISVISNLGTTEKTRTELKKLGIPFSYPKPIGLIKYLIQIGANDPDSMILDFFAGSGTCSHAVLDLNKKENSRRSVISVQLPELISQMDDAYKLGYRNIAKLSEARIKKCVKEYKYKDGIRILQLQNSSFKKWPNFHNSNIATLEQKFDFFNQCTLQDGENKQKLVTEIMLLEGFPLDSEIENLNVYKTNEVQEISSELLLHKIKICLDQKIAEETIMELNLGEMDIFICLDAAISDQDKLSLSDKGQIKTI